MIPSRPTPSPADPASSILPFDAVLFDLDGTLTDPEVGITASYRYALAAVGRPIADDVDISWVIGPPIGENLGEFGVPAAEMPVAVRAYRRRHLDVGLYEATLVPGMAGLVAALDAGGVRLALATGKPTADGELTLVHFGLAEHFEVFAGNTVDGILSKADVVAVALAQLGAPEPARVVMVGDRRHDIEGALANGVASIGVRWGFAAVGELEAAGADRIVATVDELARLLTGSSSVGLSRAASSSAASAAGGARRAEGRAVRADTRQRAGI